MVDGFTEAQVITGLFGIVSGLILIILAMIGAFFGWIVTNIRRLDGKIDALTVAVSRLEGAVYYGLPGARHIDQRDSK